MKKNAKGITLIALIITIIVLLILAGVLLSLTLGDNGIFKLAQDAARNYTNAQEKEETGLAYLNNEISNALGGSTNGSSGNSSSSETGGDITGTIADEETSYIGLYADVDGDGEIDGIIYADLAQDKNGTWSMTVDGSSKEFGSYSWDAVSNLKTYVISDEEQTPDDSIFGSRKVVTLANNSTGNDRFYVMALNMLSSTYTWHNSESWTYYFDEDDDDIAEKKIDYLDESYAVDSTDNDFGKGKANTVRIKQAWNSIWGGTYTHSGEWYDTTSVWELWSTSGDDAYKLTSNGKTYNMVENEDDTGKWFVPSKTEVTAFLGAIGNDTNITSNSNLTVEETYVYAGCGAYWLLTNDVKLWTSSFSDSVHDGDEYAWACGSRAEERMVTRGKIAEVSQVARLV